MRVLALAAALIVGAAAPPSAAALDDSAPGFHLEQVFAGYKRPLYVTAHAGANRLYIVEQRGVIHVARRSSPSSPWEKAGVFLDLRDKVVGPFVNRGLMGMAFDPDYATNGYFYVFYTREGANPGPRGDIAIARYKRATNLRAKPRSGKTLLGIPFPAAYHFGGWLGFGSDGYLYATTGDAGNVSFGFPQDLDSRLGKLLRFNPHKSDGEAGFVPADNPFVGIAGDDLIWSYGLRNPWRASFDETTGDLWLPDVGAAKWEEVNRFAQPDPAKGANLGWTMCEGAHEYPEPEAGPADCAEPTTVEPLIEYAHGDDCSVIGGYVYRGSEQAALVGQYFYGDYCTGNIWRVPADYETDDPAPPPLTTGLHITSFGVDALDEIYVTAVGGSVWRIVAD
ncbi:MAG: PQQ-dependent sugar dehydrogenase [Chloroflexota bacterium]